MDARWMGLALALVGCAESVEPRAAVVSELCGVEAADWDASAFGEVAVHGPCARAIAEDLGVTGDLEGAGPEASAIAGGLALLAWDWGTVEPGLTPLDERLASVSADTGERALGRVAYDWVAHQVHAVRAGHTENGAARWRPLTRTIVWDDPLSAPSAAGVLVHEARHGDGVRHERCPNGQRACDADAEGAYGFERDLLERAAAQSDGAVADTLWALADEAGQHVLD
ncbi:MAG: hypothetical protein R3F61_24665 [Myxococcota bacterium]